jgi:hypothetical protein
LRRCHKFFQCHYRIFCICIIPQFLKLYTRMPRQVAGAVMQRKDGNLSKRALTRAAAAG